jgi:hypothetical protein
MNGDINAIKKIVQKVDEQFLPDNFFHILKHFGRYKLALQKGKKDSFM